jgi:multisubunit Na+/H+ antiporter MnhC subunit
MDSNRPTSPSAPRARRPTDGILLLSIAIGVLTAAGIYLILRLRAFPVIVGLSMLTYSVNLFLFAMGGWCSTAAGHRPTARTMPTRCRRRWC